MRILITTWTDETLIFDQTLWMKSSTYQVFLQNSTDIEKDLHKIAKEYFSSKKKKLDDIYRTRCKKIISDELEERKGN